MAYAQKMKAKLFDIEAGKYISVIHECDAKQLAVFPLDRVEIFNPRTKKRIVTVADLTDSVVKENEIGLFEDVRKIIGAKEKDILSVSAVPQPESVKLIKKKMDKQALTEKEIMEIVKDLSDNKLSEIEASAFVSAIYINGFSLEETISMTKALVKDGERLNIEKEPVVDKHSIGGVNGRTTMILVPIIASQGLYIPKTSSRSITSSAGTADAMEILSNVCLSLEQIKKITEKIGGVIAWGGAIDLAPADDKIIKIEHPLSLDPNGQVIASVMGKKASVGARYVVIDIPVGPNTKVKTKEKAEAMARKFIEVGKSLGMKVEVVLTDGSKPCGKAFGPALEAKLVMEILEGKLYDELAEKACDLSGILLELAGKERKGMGAIKAKEILKNGKALKKMQEIIKAQGGKIFSSDQIKLSPLKKKILSEKEGEIENINVKILNEVARIAGAPADKKAGVMLKAEDGQKIRLNDVLYEIYAENRRKLELAAKYAQKNNAIELQEIIIEEIK